jgi:pimeloyl-ACP methyl ester carboxylesterase
MMNGRSGARVDNYGHTLILEKQTVSARKLHRIQAEPMYFGAGEVRMFGWLHRPPPEHKSDLGLVICNPFGYESLCSHRSVREFAESSAAAGFPTLRFDYLGTGDSADIHPRADQIEIWVANVIAAITELRASSGVTRVCLLGIRLGGLLAALAARRAPVDALVLIAPVTNGKRYLKELRTTRMAAMLGGADRGTPEDPTVEVSSLDPGAIEVSGFALSSATLATLMNVDFGDPQSVPLPRTLIIDGNSLPISRTWAEQLTAADPQARYLVLPGLIEMIMTAPQFARAPHEMIAATCDWLRQCAAEFPAVASKENDPRSPGSTMSATLSLPGNPELPSRRLSETPFFLDRDELLFSIATEPHEGEPRKRGVILLNAAVDHHIGANRMYVTLARRWASNGYFVLRMDFAGIGDSGTREGRPDDEVFPPAAVDDIAIAIDTLNNKYGIRDVTLVGLCSGGYHALRAAVAGLRVNRVMLLNPQNFYWKQGSRIEDLQEVEIVRNPGLYRERVFSIAAWRRLITGDVNLARILQIYLHRPLVSLESFARELARRIRIRLPRDLGWDLQEVAAHGVRVVFVFSRGEAGIELLKMQAGSVLYRLGDRCRLRVVDHSDHTFTQAGPRSMMERVLSEELFARVDA